MARTRTGSAVDEVDPTDRSTMAGEVPLAPELADAPKPVAAGHVRVFINARRTNPNGGEPLPAGEYELPKEEAMHFVRTGSAKVVAV